VSLFLKIKIKLLFGLGQNSVLAHKDGIFFRAYRRNPQVIQALTGDWEPVHIAIKTLSGSQTILFDIGANVGIVSLLVSRAARYIFCFEPNISAFRDLCDNLILNSSFNAIPVNLAVSSAIGTVTMSNLPSWPINKVVDSNFASHHDSAAVKDFAIVPAVTLDAFYASYVESLPHDSLLLKIDTEGHELNVLQGALSLLALPLPVCIVAEYNTLEVLLSLENFLAVHGCFVHDKLFFNDGSNAFFFNQYWPSR
jgi:FkbM family methyltransferase